VSVRPTAWAWELPQTALGLALRALLRARGGVVAEVRLSDRLLVETHALGVSLGRVVFWSRSDAPGGPGELVTLAHELGHAVQSRRLGPAYLPTVGLLSVARVVRVVASRRLGAPWDGYYDGWPEREADRLGGVVRDARGRRALGGAPAHPDLDVRR
jgi:hypothetical protein